MILCTCRDDLNLHILRMFIGTFSLDATKMYAEIFTQHVSLNCSYKNVGFPTAVSTLKVQEFLRSWYSLLDFPFLLLAFNVKYREYTSWTKVRNQETICMKCQSLLSGKKKEKYFKVCCIMRKCVFEHMQILKAQISLCFQLVWSGPLPSISRIL